MGFDSEDDISDTETDVERATAVSGKKTLQLFWNKFIISSLLLFWTVRTTFPYLRTSFLTDFKTGWIDFSKGPPIGQSVCVNSKSIFLSNQVPCQLLARISHISLDLEQQIDILRYIQFCFQSLRPAMFIIENSCMTFSPIKSSFNPSDPREIAPWPGVPLHSLTRWLLIATFSIVRIKYCMYENKF